jgi:calcium-dependent protein kinase
MLKVLDHPYIVSLIEIFETEGEVSLVMEICSGADLKSRRYQSEKEVTFIVYQILRAIAHCHYVGVVHRDLKLENVLFKSKENLGLRVIDFGLSTIYAPADSDDDFARALETVCGTYHYMAPEVLKREYSSKADIWAVGVLTYILLTGKPPFTAADRGLLEEQVKRGVVSYDPTIWENISPAARDFTKHLLTVNPEHRPSAKDALKIPWLNDFRLQHLNEVRDDEFAKKACETLLAFVSYPMLKKAALMIVSYHAELKNKEKLQNLFLAFDDEFIGELSKDQLFRMVNQHLPGTISETDFDRVFESVDQSRSKNVHLTEFLAATIETTIEITPSLVDECFIHLDTDSIGVITVGNLKYLLGKRYSEKDVEEMFMRSFERIGLQPLPQVNLTDFNKMMHWEPTGPALNNAI